MKIQALSRSLDTVLPSRPGDAVALPRNPDPSQHPFAKQREYTRAVTASKLERMFAKPFVGAIECGDGVYALARDGGRLGVVATGGGMGEIAVHDIPTRRSLLSLPSAHSGIVNALAFSHTSKSARGDARLLSGGVDRAVRMWDASGSDADVDGGDAGEGSSAGVKPIRTWTAKAAVHAITHHRQTPTFATASNCVQIWDESRSEPTQTYQWGHELLTCLTFSPSETSVLASSGSDRTLSLWDLRVASGSIGRILTPLKSNHLAFNPLLPTLLLAANEDHNLYTWDIRNLGGGAVQVYKDHVAAVMGCEWSPTGGEIVSGGWDRTVRIWDRNHGRSKDCYHTKRMQRVMTATYTLDARFILTGSDDGNLRIWKARAADKLGVVDGREREKTQYRDALRERWSEVGEVRKVERRRNIPKAVRNAAQLKRTVLDAARVREENRRAHTRAGQSKPRAEKKKAVVAEQT